MENHSGIVDSGAFFKVVSRKRIVKVPSSHKVIGTVGEHMSEAITFQVDKTIEGHDIKECAEHYLTWINAKGEKGHDPLNLVDEDEEFLYFTWEIRGNTTVEAGIVSFSLHFKDYSDDGELCYDWGTSPCKECEILNRINAAVATYQLIYIDGDTLVFADYTPVRDGTIMLETTGIVPEGSMTIEANGHYSVGELAGVDVAVPRDNPFTLELQDGGLMVASDGVNTTITHQLEMPSISIDDGKVTAAANGLDAEHPLDAPTIDIEDGGIVKAENYGVETTHQLDAPTIDIEDGGIVKAENYGMETTRQLDAPDITIADGKVTAEANGLTADKDLDSPTITFNGGYVTATANGLTKKERIWVDELVKRTKVSVHHSAGGLLTCQGINSDTNAMELVPYPFTHASDLPTELYLIAGSYLYFTTVSTASYITVNDVLVTDEITYNGVSYKFIIVPEVEDGTVVKITMN